MEYVLGILMQYNSHFISLIMKLFDYLVLCILNFIDEYIYMYKYVVSLNNCICTEAYLFF